MDDKGQPVAVGMEELSGETLETYIVKRAAGSSSRLLRFTVLGLQQFVILPTCSLCKVNMSSAATPCQMPMLTHAGVWYFILYVAHGSFFP